MTSRRGIRSALFRPLDMSLQIVEREMQTYQSHLCVREAAGGGESNDLYLSVQCFANNGSKSTAVSFHSLSSLHYDKAIIARMTSVDKTSTTASNEGVKLAARFILVRFHASPGIIILKNLLGVFQLYVRESKRTI